jgi:AraC-like DNA-binding protein
VKVTFDGVVQQHDFSPQNSDPVKIAGYHGNPVIDKFAGSFQKFFPKGIGNGICYKGKKAERVAVSLEKMVHLSGLALYIELLKVFNLLLQIEDREYLALPSTQPHIHEKDIDQINKVYEYVFQHIQDGIRLREVSDLVCMEPGSFCRYFKKKTNQTFMDYVKNVRVGIASKLLAETDKPITQICFECGYNNLANFNYYFKAIMKKTPSEYRKDLK